MSKITSKTRQWLSERGPKFVDVAVKIAALIRFVAWIFGLGG